MVKRKSDHSSSRYQTTVNAVRLMFCAGWRCRQTYNRAGKTQTLTCIKGREPAPFLRNVGRAQNAFTTYRALCNARPPDMMTVRFFATACAALLLTGCATTTITNLTPSKVERNSSGLYQFEVALETRQQSLRQESLQPYVLIGLESYPMQPTPVLKNRWETLVPIPADESVVHYRYKFDYEYNSIPQRRKSSLLSAPYRLQIEGGPSATAAQ